MVVALPCTVMLLASEAARVVAPETANDMNESVLPVLPVMSAWRITIAFPVEIVTVAVGPLVARSV